MAEFLIFFSVLGLVLLMFFLDTISDIMPIFTVLTKFRAWYCNKFMKGDEPIVKHICKDCKFFRRSWRGLPATCMANPKIDYVMGEKLYASCDSRNYNGLCPLFEEKLKVKERKPELPEPDLDKIILITQGNERKKLKVKDD
ncbi:MAG: hypothetical protein GX452_13895 [Ignavibacteriales bacterium]|nr:hypothetical protein [Ignavibacteriales bacterium]